MFYPIAQRFSIGFRSGLLANQDNIEEMLSCRLSNASLPRRQAPLHTERSMSLAPILTCLIMTFLLVSACKSAYFGALPSKIINQNLSKEKPPFHIQIDGAGRFSGL